VPIFMPRNEAGPSIFPWASYASLPFWSIFSMMYKFYKLIRIYFIFCFCGATPKSGEGRLTVEVSRSHTIRHARALARTHIHTQAHTQAHSVGLP
jgi:hypothetical protein